MKTETDNSEQDQQGEAVRYENVNSSMLTEILFYLCFAAITFLIYSNTFQSPIIFDDWLHIEANPHIQISDLSWDALRKAAFESPLEHRPVPYLSLALNYYFGGFDLTGYHLVNIFIHLITAIFLYMFLKTTLSLQQNARVVSVSLVSFTATLIWLVHPAHTQSVTYLIQRMNSLAALFYILALLLYARGRLATGSMERLVCFAGCILSGILALGSKENAAMLPFFILLYEWFFFQDLSFAWMRKNVFPILSVIVLLAIIVAVYLGENPIDRILGGYGYREFTLEQRLLTQLRVVLFYISLLFFPSPARLNIDHDFQLSLSMLDPATTLYSSLVLSCMFVLALVLSRRERVIGFAILWFLGNLMIESSVIGLEIIFDHRTYLPSMLAVLAVVLVASRISLERWLQVSVASLVVLLFSVWTFQRNIVWQDEITLRHDAALKSPEKSRAIAILANALERNHQYQEAEFYYKQTLALKPRNADEIHYNLGNVLLAEKKYDEAVLNFRKAVALRPKIEVMRLNLAHALTLQGQLNEAAKELKVLLEQNPENYRAHNNLGIVYMNQRRFNQAVLHFNIALKLNPNYQKARNNLKAALTMARDSRATGQ